MGEAAVPVTTLAVEVGRSTDGRLEKHGFDFFEHEADATRLLSVKLLTKEREREMRIFLTIAWLKSSLRSLYNAGRI